MNAYYAKKKTEMLRFNPVTHGNEENPLANTSASRRQGEPGRCSSETSSFSRAPALVRHLFTGCPIQQCTVQQRRCEDTCELGDHLKADGTDKSLQNCAITPTDTNRAFKHLTFPYRQNIPNLTFKFSCFS